MSLNNSSTFFNCKMKKNTINTYDLMVNFPRFIKLNKKSLLIFRNLNFQFYESRLYEIGQWKFTLKQHGDGFYLEKEKIS